jgi:hypothetical protein
MFDIASAHRGGCARRVILQIDLDGGEGGHHICIFSRVYLSRWIRGCLFMVDVSQAAILGQARKGASTERGDIRPDSQRIHCAPGA